MQINSKITKNASSPSFLDRFWFCLLYLIGLIGGLKICFKSHKLLLLLHFSTNFYSVCFIFFFFFFTEPRKGPGVQSAIIFFCFFMSLPGHQIYIFLTLIFFFYVPFGASYFYFLTSRKLYHMKFAIFDVARCRMSVTSLTYLLLLVSSPCQEIVPRCLS